MKNQTRLPDPITVTHVTAGNVVAVGTFHVYAAATTWSWKINHSITPNHDYLTQNNATIDIWLLKSNDLSNLGIIIDKKIDLYIETIVNTMKSENLLGDNVDTEYLKNLIKFNLSQIDYE